MLAVAREGARISDDPARLAAARDQFATTSVVVLRGFLVPPLLTWVQTHVGTGVFQDLVHPASGVEQCMVDNEVIWMLSFLLGAPDVLRAVENITDQRPLTTTKLRVYRFEPGSGHHHRWHDDLGDGRRLGLSVNLSAETFEGGNLQLRKKGTERLLCDVRNTGAGDAAIFRLAKGVQHQVLPVTGREPRVALAGWFRE